MRFLIFATLIILSLVNKPAAAEWTSVGRSVGGAELLIDFTTLRSGVRPRAWFMWKYPEGTRHGAGSTVILREANCSEGTLRSLSKLYYTEPDGKGEPFQKSNQPEEWEHVPPGTMAEMVLNTICGQPQ